MLLPNYLIQSLISSSLEQSIAFRPIFARLMGGPIGGLFLSQAYYWSDKGRLKDGWVYKTQKDFEQETMLTRHQQDRARANLREKKWWEEKIDTVPGIPALGRVLHFRIDREKLLTEICALQLELRGIEFDLSSKGFQVPDSIDFDKLSKKASKRSSKNVNPDYRASDLEIKSEEYLVLEQDTGEDLPISSKPFIPERPYSHSGTKKTTPEEGGVCKKLSTSTEITYTENTYTENTHTPPTPSLSKSDRDPDRVRVENRFRSDSIDPEPSNIFPFVRKTEQDISQPRGIGVEEIPPARSTTDSHLFVDKETRVMDRWAREIEIRADRKGVSNLLDSLIELYNRDELRPQYWRKCSKSTHQLLHRLERLIAGYQKSFDLDFPDAVVQLKIDFAAAILGCKHSDFYSKPSFTNGNLFWLLDPFYVDRLGGLAALWNDRTEEEKEGLFVKMSSDAKDGRSEGIPDWENPGQIIPPDMIPFRQQIYLAMYSKNPDHPELPNRSYLQKYFPSVLQ